MQSEAVPEGWDTQLVKELMGLNLQEVAFNPRKSVFLMFCMQTYCEGCRFDPRLPAFLSPVSHVSSDLSYSSASWMLFPLWEELAAATGGREGVVVARIDASANDLGLSPPGTYPVPRSSTRCTPSFLSFLDILYQFWLRTANWVVVFWWSEL